MRTTDLIIIGGGPAGMAAAIAARENGVKDIVIIEREKELGGILQQCIHNGFGLHVFNEELTGPEYAYRFIERIEQLDIKFILNTMVLEISTDKIVTAVSSESGLFQIKTKAIILAMGCRERTRGALNIPGTRPSGIYTAGTAQRFVNMEGYLPGKEVVILGSGDIGLIMARRMTFEGANVKMVCEILPYAGGLSRNIVQCLDDYNIPLILRHTIVEIHGKERLEGVTIAKVDENRKPIKETEEYVGCDTLLLSVGLIPENELSIGANILLDSVTSGPIVNESMETSVQGIFACGNVVHVNDLVDNVTQESYLAGKSSADYIINYSEQCKPALLKTVAGNGIKYVVPHYIRKEYLKEDSKLFFRVTDVYLNVKVIVRCGNDVIYSAKKLKVIPGEMESISLTSQLASALETNNELAIELIDC